MCVSLFSKSQSFLIKLHVRASLENYSMDNIYQNHFFTGALKKCFGIFEKLLEKSPSKSGRFQVFWKIGVLKKFTNFTREHQCCSQFLIKSPETKTLQHCCFHVDSAKLFRNAFFTEHNRWSWSLSLKGFALQVFTKKFLIDWLQTNSYLIARIICALLTSPFSL